MTGLTPEELARLAERGKHLEEAFERGKASLLEFFTFTFDEVVGGFVVNDLFEQEMFPDLEKVLPPELYEQQKANIRNLARNGLVQSEPLRTLVVTMIVLYYGMLRAYGHEARAEKVLTGWALTEFGNTVNAEFHKPEAFIILTKRYEHEVKKVIAEAKTKG